MPKSFLKLKPGLLEPKHAKAMGIKIWLYLKMCELASKSGETGEIPDWTDERGAEIMGMPKRTVKDQRQGLAEAGYITCEQGYHRVRVRIEKWVNPWSPWNGDTPGVPMAPNGDTPTSNMGTPNPIKNEVPSYSKIKILDSKSEKTPRPHPPLFDAVSEVCKVDPKTAWSSVAKVAKSLSGAGYTPQDLQAFDKWWWGKNGMRQRPPTVWQLKEQIGVVKMKPKTALDPTGCKSFKRMGKPNG